MKRISKLILNFLKPLSIPFVAIILLLILYFAGYVIVPEDLDFGQTPVSRGWDAVVTEVEARDNGRSRIYLTLHNKSGEWSSMRAVESKAAVLNLKSGKAIECPVVFVSTGGHRVAPEFLVRGYQAGHRDASITQLNYIECALAKIPAGAKLSLTYTYVTGEYNYYEPDANRLKATLVVDLDTIVKDLKYPLFRKDKDFIKQADFKITALNQVILSLSRFNSHQDGLEFIWHTYNPGDYQSYVHIGVPPVIGDDGVIYGFYVSPDLPPTPVTPPGKTAEWNTRVAVPEDVGSLYVLLSVETGKQRLFVHYAIEIGDR